MQALRTITCSLALGALLVVPASAERITQPGTYAVNVVVLPAYVPSDLPVLGPNVYSGTAEIMATGSGVKVEFRGVSPEGHELDIKSKFMTGWRGMLLADIPVGFGSIPNAVVGIDADWMLEATVKGVGSVDGVTQRIKAKVGMHGVVESIKVLSASTSPQLNDVPVNGEEEESSWGEIKDRYR